MRKSSFYGRYRRENAVKRTRLAFDARNSKGRANPNYNPLSVAQRKTTIQRSRSNEREFGGKLKSWGDQYLRYGGTPFSKFEIESGITVAGSRARRLMNRFPDLHLYRRSDNSRAYIYSLKTPETQYDDVEELRETAAESGSAQYFVTWNMQEAAIWRTVDLHRVSHYGPIADLRTSDDISTSLVEDALIDMTHRIIEDLAVLDSHGSLAQVTPDGSFFVRQLRSSVDRHLPLVEIEAVRLQRSSAGRSLDVWAVRQGVSLTSAPQIAAKQATYRLFAQILFYYALRRTFSILPAISNDPLDVIPSIREALNRAAEIDFQAVFKRDPLLDDLSSPQSASLILAGLVQNLERYDFSRLSQDVLGQVFEGLIPSEERHRLGQYFTDDSIARLLTRLVVRAGTTTFLDPTCGTGTFLLSAYGALTVSGCSHDAAIERIWGVDIAPFPAELATINLHRRDLRDRSSFPRVLVQDIMTIEPGKYVTVPLASSDVFGAASVNLAFPRFQGIAGNLPFISFNDLARYEPGVRADTIRGLARMWFAKHPQLFEVSRDLRGDIARGQDPTMLSEDQLAFVTPLIGGRADYYVYLLLYVVGLLADSGEAVLITSTSWMDAAYAANAQRFLMTVSRLRYVVASYVEPWFTSVSVNVSATGVCADGETDVVNFVAMTGATEALADQEQGMYAATHYPEVFRAAARYPRLGTTTYQQRDLPVRIRQVNRSELERSPKWVRFLRAPEPVLALQDELFDRLTTLASLEATVRRGTKTGLDGFFYVSPGNITRFHIEGRYIRPVLKSPASDITPTPQDLSSAFVCSEDLAELRRTGATGALAYINYGAECETSGTPWPRTLSLQPRIAQGHPWYSLPQDELTRIAVPLAFDDTLRHHYADEPFLINQRLTGIKLPNTDDEILLAAYLNSSVGLLFTETFGRTVLGQGALDFPREDLAQHLLVPRLENLRASREEIERTFRALLGRRSLPWLREASALGRLELDNAMLRALGSRQSGAVIRNALIQMVTQRKELARQRNVERRGRTQSDYDLVLRRIIDRLPFSAGLRRFPDGFFSGSTRNLARVADAAAIELFPLLGHVEMRFGSETITMRRDECAFALYSYTSGAGLLIGEDISEAVASFERYLDECAAQVREALIEVGIAEANESLESDVCRETGLSDFLRWKTKLE